MPREAARGVRQIAYTLVLIAFLKGCTPVLGAQEPSIKVEVTPKVQLSNTRGQGSVLIKVTTPRSPQNRVVCVILDGPMYRSSCWENGPESPLRKELRYTSLSAGEYVVVGVLEWVEEGSGKRQTTTARDNFRISGGEPSGF
mgnify:CR=1 FL=1